MRVFNNFSMHHDATLSVLASDKICKRAVLHWQACCKPNELRRCIAMGTNASAPAAQDWGEQACQ